MVENGTSCNILYIYDLDRVSLFPGARHYERRPGGVEGRVERRRIPGVIGAAPLRHPGYEKRTPAGVQPTGRRSVGKAAEEDRRRRKGTIPPAECGIFAAAKYKHI